MANIYGTAGADTLTGYTTSSDTIYGYGGNDTIDSGNDAYWDLVYAGDGNDLVYGGSGDDIFGGDGNDDLRANSVGSTGLLSGDAGDDILRSGNQAITMDGGTGFDQLVAGTNRDIMYGGADTDYFWFAGITSVGDQVDGGSGYDYILANGSNTSITLFSIVNVEHIHANTYTGVYISGTSAAENLDFSATTLTNIQNIQMLGGDDTVTGSAAADVICGGDGNDIIAGAGGADILIGGNGSNTFDFNSIAHSSAASADTIWDFWQAASDKIDLLTIDANTGLAGDQAFSFIGLAAFSSVSGQLRYDNTTNPGWTSVFADNNGDSVADFRVDLNGTYTLLSGDFVL